AIFSSTLLLLVSLTALANALRRPLDGPVWKRAPWLVLGGVFLFMSLDEYFSIHESYEHWRQAYVMGGVLLVLTGLILGVLERDLRPPLVLVIGLACIGTGGVVLDAFANEAVIEFGGYEADWLVCKHDYAGIICQDYGIIEELLELAGISIILAGFLSFAQDHTQDRQAASEFRLARRVLAGAAVLWVVWAFSHVWVIPTFEAKLLADGVHVEFLDGALRLESYQIKPEAARPGDEVRISLFFRANRPLDHNYYLSVHLLSHPEVDTWGQDDLQLGEWDYPSSAWIPGFAVRNDVYLTLPADIPAPASYWVAVKVWQGPDLHRTPKELLDPDIKNVEVLVSDSDRPVITPDTVQLVALPVLGNPPPDDPPTAADYRFDNGMRLTGYDLPAVITAGDPAAFRFWWRTDKTTGKPLTHYLHFFGEGDLFFVFDHQAFDDRFPMVDWPAGLDAADSWTITPDLPAGEYRVYTGVYHTPTVTRIPVRDADGRPVPDNAIFLGTVTVK
ncbi:MAG: hypothetical protein JXQ72_13915, partial [Anaerolineae bacterium]|nr:hypothetical protein [Anaerolineae bacterium]